MVAWSSIRQRQGRKRDRSEGARLLPGGDGGGENAHVDQKVQRALAQLPQETRRLRVTTMSHSGSLLFVCIWNDFLDARDGGDACAGAGGHRAQITRTIGVRSGAVAAGRGSRTHGRQHIRGQP